MEGYEEDRGGMRGRVWWEERLSVVGRQEECGGMRGRVLWDER